MRKRMDLKGERFGRLLVIADAGVDNRNRSLFTCLCDCGQECVRPGARLKAGDSSSCGCLRKELARTRRTRGKQVKRSGYVMVYPPDGYTGPTTKRGLIMEHRLVMEGIIGRHLLPGENVHHKNGVRHDNRPENLELWVTSQPAGQRPEDLVEWAKEILRRYDN